ncbi:MAG: CoA pyrophosphatase, partial [Phaeodactylibacter sp.]|nr:CoA pyrophosphatase [Phaeodactylibacter sp.]
MKNVPFNALQDRLRGPLPGQAAQFRMAHAIRQEVPPPPPSAKIASVLALFFPKEEGWHLVLIERVSHNPNDRHGGQISFPGGRRE